jgi:hypothetical protein
MSMPNHIVDGHGSGYRAQVTSNGQLVVGPLAFDSTKYLELGTADTAYNFYGAEPGKQFVITGIRAKADKQVSSSVDATVIIYEASSSTSTTVDKVLHQEAMTQGDTVTMRTNILVNEGKYVNAKTTDDDIHMTIFGYYVGVVE